MVPRRLEQVHLLIAQRLLDYSVRIAREHAAVDVQGSLSPHERTSALSAVRHHDSVGVDILDASFRLGVVGWYDFDRPGMVHVKSPLSDVVMMRAHIRVSAARVLAVVP